MLLLLRLLFWLRFQEINMLKRCVINILSWMNIMVYVQIKDMLLGDIWMEYDNMVVLNFIVNHLDYVKQAMK